MSMERELAIGYGIIISDDKVQDIDCYLDDDEIDALSDDGYLRCINSWIGDDYFLGVINYFGSTEEPIVLNGKILTIDKKEIENFENFLSKQPWRKEICWEPETYLIEFIY